MVRNCFISYHHADEREVRAFVDRYRNTISARGIGGGVNDRDLFINSPDRDYVMREIRRKYLGPSSITIVLIGPCTWSRQYVDWEIASSLRNSVNSKRSGLLAIHLPSVRSQGTLPERLRQNVDSGYALNYRYPVNGLELSQMLDAAVARRERFAHFATNSLRLQSGNRLCLQAGSL